MDDVYKNQDGEWEVSEWEDGMKHETREDGHTYTRLENGEVGHLYCWCLK